MTPGQYRVRIRYQNTECPGVRADIDLNDDLTDLRGLTSGPSPHLLASAPLDAGAEPGETTFSFVADPAPGERVVLSLFTKGGLHCGGNTFVDSVTLTPESRTLTPPPFCRRCRRCVRRLRQAQLEASLEDAAFAKGSLWDESASKEYDYAGIGLLPGPNWMHGLTASVRWDRPAGWVNFSDEGGADPDCDLLAASTRTSDRAPLRLRREVEHAVATLRGCAPPAQVRLFKKLFEPALDDCLKL